MKQHQYIPETIPRRSPARKLHFRGPLPNLSGEGYWDRLPVPLELVVPPLVENADRSHTYLYWSSALTPWERLHNHQTLASCRRHACFHPYFRFQSCLDKSLRGMYDHSREFMPDKLDVYISPETADVSPIKCDNTYWKEFEKPLRRGHPLRIGGVAERIHPDSVKLNLPSIYSSKSAPGYVRKIDGSLYNC